MRLVSLTVLLLLALTGCVREQPEIIVITATFLPPTQVGVADSVSIPATNIVPTITLSEEPQGALSQPTPNPIRPTFADNPSEHIVQPGDTLMGIAQQYNLTLDALIEANDLINPDLLDVGQIVQLPSVIQTSTSDFKIIPDSRLVRAPGSVNFNIAAFIAQQPGYIRRATDTVTTRIHNGAGLERDLNAVQIVERVALEYSVDPRLLLMLLEYRAGWLSNPQPIDTLKEFPLISEAASRGIDRAGMYRQLSWAANELNRGYYGWKYRGRTGALLSDGSRAIFNSGLNAGTIGLQHMLSLAETPPAIWERDISIDGFYSTYVQYFGDPFLDGIDPIVPTSIAQPDLMLPFVEGEVWRYTGGPHGGWGNGSAWAALDFAPPDERPSGASFCYTSQSWTTAIASGVIARSGDGAVVLDLDGDGDESTGWTILYLHLADETLIDQGARVNVGDFVGRTSCAGGFSSATHLHIGRRFNGEWLPAECQACLAGTVVPPFIMGGWQAQGIANQEYQGYMQRNNVQIRAEQGRLTTINQISW